MHVIWTDIMKNTDQHPSVINNHTEMEIINQIRDCYNVYLTLPSSIANVLKVGVKKGTMLFSMHFFML